MITKAFLDLLHTTPEVSQLVDGRIQPNFIKKGTALPAVYVLSDRMEKQGCYDSQGTHTGILEIGIHAETYEEAQDVVDAIRNTLDEFSGTVSNVGIVIMNGQVLGDNSDEDTEVHIKVVEYEAIAEPK
ncbi:Protein of unknown function [Dyadobacter soli]|uniref:DUF3168 domain-containing protein n=1 Tax=Dyadobacter soli TaxID=659014 RepID=A0A1G7G3I2_9BACT|nr:DUF3168 domain-containing protein [Dyadobacter soli]SDE82657.1 Protein of unknown function [Dyadobacter soli]